MDEQGRVWFTARVRPPDNPDVLQKRFGPSVGESLSDEQREPPSLDVRSEEQEVHADQHLLFDASSGVRRGRQSYAVDQRRRSGERGGRLAQSKDVRRNRRRTEVARLDADHPRHQRQRQARRMGRTQSAGRSDQRQADGGGFLRHRRQSGRRFGLGIDAGISQRHRAPQSRAQIRRRPRSRKSTKCRSNPGAYGIRGMDIDRNGVVWSSLSSGHLASFDRRKCKGPLNGPTPTGKHCPEGWTLHTLPGPNFESLNEPGSAESSYYTWVDQFDTFGLGKDVPIATGNLNDSLLALVDGKIRQPARALSARLLRQVDGRTHRQSKDAAGRARACGRRLGRARHSTWKAVKARGPRW